MLLHYGNKPVWKEWIVDEAIPPGFCRVYFIHGGDVTYTDEYYTKKLIIGNVYIFPSASTFKITHDPNNTLVCTYFHVDLIPIVVTNLIELDLERDKLLFDLMATIKSAIELGNNAIMSSLVDSFIVYLKELNIVRIPDFNISKALTFISENIMTKITIKQLSQLVGYNEQYFIRMFKSAIGISPHQYIINQKLKLSLKLIDSGLSISETANQLGYSDIKAFSHCFTNKFGVSPSKYKLMILI